MCLILFAYDVHPRYRLVLAANRDEFYQRPASPLHFWEDHPDILAGRDLKGMGTWLGISRSGCLAALTNYRSPAHLGKDAPTRGNLVADFLKGRLGPSEYLDKISVKADTYNGFNLIVGDRNGLYYASNRGEWSRSLRPGIYGISNHLLDTPWPKVSSGVTRLKDLVAGEQVSLFSGAEEILKNRDIPPDDRLPDTGVGPVWERLLAPIFISSQSYGTRSSSIVTIDRTGNVRFKEITWECEREAPHVSVTCEMSFFLA